MTGNTSICNTSKIDFRRLEALSCGVWPSPGFSLLSSRISLQNRRKCRFEPTFKKACPARLSERKSLISSGFRRVRGLQKQPQNGHPRHSCIKDSKFVGLVSFSSDENPVFMRGHAVRKTEYFAVLSVSSFQKFFLCKKHQENGGLTYTEAYRSGHNGPDSKSFDGQKPSVGSNPTPSASEKPSHIKALRPYDWAFLFANLPLLHMIFGKKSCLPSDGLGFR